MSERVRSLDQLVVARPAIYVAEEYLANGCKRLPLESLGFPGFVLVHDALEMHDPPKGHENSQAVYLADYYNGSDRILVSFLRPNSQSSRHYHSPPITEFYWLLAGEAKVGEKLIPKGGFVINPEEVHQVTTEGNGALLLISMTNAGLVPEDKQHIYCSFEVGSWVKVRNSTGIPFNLPQRPENCRNQP
ncbi:MAG: hypothetical protein Q8P89_02925 [bacterium]|nr:hypothetical protein [bacterium]